MSKCTREELIDFFTDLSLEPNNDKFFTEIITPSFKKVKARQTDFQVGVIKGRAIENKVFHRKLVEYYVLSKSTQHWVDHCKLHFGDDYVVQ